MQSLCENERTNGVILCHNVSPDTHTQVRVIVCLLFVDNEETRVANLNLIKFRHAYTCQPQHSPSLLPVCREMLMSDEQR